MALARVTLKSGREKSLRLRHPWIFSGAIDRVEGTPEMGATIAVHSGTASRPRHGVRSRRFAPECGASMPDVVDSAYGQGVRGPCALALRCSTPATPAADRARRVGWVAADADRYGDVVVVICLGRRRAWRDVLARLQATSGCSTVFERSDAEVRMEGLLPRAGSSRQPPGPWRVEDALSMRRCRMVRKLASSRSTRQPPSYPRTGA